MSSINSNGANGALPYVPQNSNSGAAQGPQGTKGSAAPAGVGVGRGAIVSDEMAQAIGSGQLDVTKQKPPVPAETRPEGYTQNLRGAAESLETFQAGASSPFHVALAAKDAGSKLATTDSDQTAKDDKQAQSRQRQISSQAKSILDSTSESEKGSCKTKYTNHADNVKAMQQCGLSKGQAERITRLLEDGRTDQSVKDKVAYQLAAIGMTAHGASKPLAGNNEEIKKSLGNLRVATSEGEPTIRTKDLDQMKAADTSYAPTVTTTRTGGELGAYSSKDLLNPEFLATSPSSATSGSQVGALTSAQSAIAGSALRGAHSELKDV